MNIQERKELLLTRNDMHDNRTLSLAVEGRYTNLRIWIGRKHAPINPDNTMLIHMRLDCHNQYSAPISKKSAQYVKNTLIHELAERFVFGDDVSKLDELLELTKEMPERECLPW